MIGNKLRIALPTKFCEELGLRAGDYVDLIKDNGDVKLKFVRVEPPAELETA
jgi:AbrB family looped-hinge helix DNA binding protein